MDIKQLVNDLEILYDLLDGDIEEAAEHLRTYIDELKLSKEYKEQTK